METAGPEGSAAAGACVDRPTLHGSLGPVTDLRRRAARPGRPGPAVLAAAIVLTQSKHTQDHARFCRQ